MYTTRNTSSHNENYCTSRNKILSDFLTDEQAENLKYIEETESLVSQTKLFLKDLLSGSDFETLKDELEELETELENDCNIMSSEIETLKVVDNQIESKIQNAQKQEETSRKDYIKKIDDLKLELESKEFTIQNMERLYIEIENVIKNNIQQGNDQLLTMEQFHEFISKNDKLKKEIRLLQIEYEKLTNDYHKLIKENLSLRSKDESFELEKIKDALNEKEINDNDITHKVAENKIKALQDKNKVLTKECKELTIKIKELTHKLQGLNIDNEKFNEELEQIKKELVEYTYNVDNDNINDNDNNNNQSFNIKNQRPIKNKSFCFETGNDDNGLIYRHERSNEGKVKTNIFN